MDAADVAGVGPLGVAAGNTLSRIPIIIHSIHNLQIHWISTICIKVVSVVVDIVCEQFFISGIKLILLIPVYCSLAHP